MKQPTKFIVASAVVSSLVFLAFILGAEFGSGAQGKTELSGMGARAVGRTHVPTVNLESAVISPAGNSQELANKENYPVKFTPFSPYGKEIFGSMVLTWSQSKSVRGTRQATDNINEARHYGDNCQIGVILENVKRGEVYEISVAGDGFVKRNTLSVRIEDDAQFVTAGPSTVYDYSQLRSNRQTVLFNMTFEVSRNGGKSVSRTESWQAHQLNDCPIMLKRRYVSISGVIGSYDLPWPTTFSGYVNENHPWVDVILREALETKICSSFSGYGEGDGKAIGQVMAIWRALANRQIKYSNIATSTDSKFHRFQHVRFIEESLGSSQANCVDGSVLLASLLRKVGFNVGIIIVPGHAYVSVYNKNRTERWFGIETTMISSSSLEDSIKFATFDYEYALSKISDKLDDRTQNIFTEISISKFRELGVLPIPYTGTETLAPHSPGVPISPSAVRPRLSNANSLAPEASYPDIFDDTAQRRYLADRGIRTSLAHDNEIRAGLDATYREAYKYDHLPPREAARMRRVDLASKLNKRMVSVISGLADDPFFLEKTYYWRELVSEINLSRTAFNSISRPPNISTAELDKLTEQQRIQVNEAYTRSVSILKMDPYDGVAPADIPAKDFPAVVNRANEICKALGFIASLPLEY